MSGETKKVDVLAVMDACAEVMQIAINESKSQHREASLTRKLASHRQARAALAELIEVATRAIPFLHDEGEKYEDDGSNEPLETARDLEAILARIGGAA